MIEGFEDPIRLLRYEESVGDAERRLLTAAAQAIWDDCWQLVSEGAAERSKLIALLPATWQSRAADDVKRWIATFATVAWKLAQPDPPRPTTMAEQLLVGQLVAYAERSHDALGVVGPTDFDEWIDAYLEDVDHEYLLDPALDGFDDDATGGWMRLGRMDYEGAFEVFNPIHEEEKGCPNPLAPLRMSQSEFVVEEGLRQVARQLALSIARACMRGETTLAVPDGPHDPELVVDQARKMLREVDLQGDPVEAPLGVTMRLDETDLDWLGWWLERNE